VAARARPAIAPALFLAFAAATAIVFYVIITNSE
jgi:hypothetical protein